MRSEHPWSKKKPIWSPDIKADIANMQCINHVVWWLIPCIVFNVCLNYLHVLPSFVPFSTVPPLKNANEQIETAEE